MWQCCCSPLTAFAEDTTEETTEPQYVLDYFEGTALDVSQYEGQVLFLNFFTEWCPYCMAEMPDIKEVYDLYDPDSLEIILVHPWDGEDASNTASVVKTYGLEGITTIEDEDHELTALVGVPGYPTSIMIDKDGYLYYAGCQQAGLQNTHDNFRYDGRSPGVMTQRRAPAGSSADDSAADTTTGK